jgi:murein DD-endopeptidase MepM/ murein hydrolase activator NlpD
MKIAALWLVGVAVLAGTARAGTTADAVEVKFCPASAAHSYPLDTMRDAHSVLLQNVALINRSTKPVSIDAVEITLRAGDQIVESRRLSSEMLAKTAKGGVALQASGMMKLASFQFCGSELLGDATLSGTTTLEPGTALLIASQPFAFKGARDQLDVKVFGGGAKAVRVGGASLPLQSGFAKTELVFPLTGAWWVGNGASFHSGHRWAIPEEFALDLIKFDANGKTHRGDGQKFTDYYAYGAKIVAPAAGKVVLAITNEAEDATVLRRPGEDAEAYFGRVLGGQAERMALGLPAILGNGVIIDHGNGEYSLLAHMKPGSVKVAVGDMVAKGQEIGAVGSSGNSTEPHLHYHVCDKPDGLLCAGIPMNFTNIDNSMADLPRPLQTGDVVVAK